MRGTGLLLLTVGLAAWAGELVAGDWKNPPLYVSSEKVELLVAREITLVTGHYTFEYQRADDQEHLPWVYVHYPFYVEKTGGDWRDLERIANFEFIVGGKVIEPDSGSIVEAKSLSTQTLPEDAAVLFLTFKIPRALAEAGFAATIQYTQANFSYRGARLALHTPWLPRSIQHHPLYNLPDNVFELRLVTSKDVTMQRIKNRTAVTSDSPTEVVAFPEHGQTVAVTLAMNDTGR